MAIVGPWAIAVYGMKIQWGAGPVPTKDGMAPGDIHTFSDEKSIDVARPSATPTPRAVDIDRLRHDRRAKDCPAGGRGRLAHETAAGRGPRHDGASSRRGRLQSRVRSASGAPPPQPAFENVGTNRYPLPGTVAMNRGCR